jgi:hypothetical protein
MKKITKIIIAVVLIAIMSMTNITTFASEDLRSPRLSHTNDGSFVFSATSGGGYVDVTYYGYDSFVRADLTVKVERRYLWLIWTEIDTWSASSTQKNGYFLHTFTLTGSATYRATFTLKITGSDGTVDTIERVIESKY